MLLESSVTSSRHSDRCTLGKVIKLYKSCCCPFAVVTKQNDWGMSQNCPQMRANQRAYVFVSQETGGEVIS